MDLKRPPSWKKQKTNKPYTALHSSNYSEHTNFPRKNPIQILSIIEIYCSVTGLAFRKLYPKAPVFNAPHASQDGFILCVPLDGNLRTLCSWVLTAWAAKNENLVLSVDFQSVTKRFWLFFRSPVCVAGWFHPARSYIKITERLVRERFFLLLNCNAVWTHFVKAIELVIHGIVL